MAGFQSSAKIFVGNLSDEVTVEDLSPYFEDHGRVIRTDILKNFAFVHMEEKEDAMRAIKDLNGKLLLGRAMHVEISTGVRSNERRSKSKVFVGNLHYDTNVDDLTDLFSECGRVVECDILTNFAFVHMSTEQEAMVAVDTLNDRVLNGKRIRVQISTCATPIHRKSAGTGCFRCGSLTHKSRQCVKVLSRSPSPTGYAPPAPFYHHQPYGGNGYLHPVPIRRDYGYPDPVGHSGSMRWGYEEPIRSYRPYERAYHPPGVYESRARHRSPIDYGRSPGYHRDVLYDRKYSRPSDYYYSRDRY